MKPLTPPREVHENHLPENETEPAWWPKTATRQKTARMVMPMYSIAIRTHWTQRLRGCRNKPRRSLRRRQLIR